MALLFRPIPLNRIATATLVIASICISSPVPCSAKDETYSVFTSKRFNYTIDIPIDYAIDGSEGNLTTFSYHPAGENETLGVIVPMITIVITSIPEGYTEKDIFGSKLKSLEDDSRAPGSRLVDLEIPKLDGGHAIIVKEIWSDDPQAINHWYVHVFDNGRHYFIDISSNYKTFRENKSIFRHVIESFTTK